MAVFHDYAGRVHYQRVERDFLSDFEGVSYLPVGVVHIDDRKQMALIELSHEAETGANRLWVTRDQLDPRFEVFQ